jgi:hypothetical protein
MAQDMSRSGIYFVVPSEVSADQPLELEVVIPDDITHRGDMTFRFVAEPVRQEEMNGALGIHQPAVGVAARLVLSPSEAAPEETLQSKESSR